MLFVYSTVSLLLLTYSTNFAEAIYHYSATTGLQFEESVLIQGGNHIVKKQVNTSVSLLPETTTDSVGALPPEETDTPPPPPPAGLASTTSLVDAEPTTDPSETSATLESSRGTALTGTTTAVDESSTDTAVDTSTVPTEPTETTESTTESTETTESTTESTETTESTTESTEATDTMETSSTMDETTGDPPISTDTEVPPIRPSSTDTSESSSEDPTDPGPTDTIDTTSTTSTTSTSSQDESTTENPPTQTETNTTDSASTVDPSVSTDPTSPTDTGGRGEPGGSDPPVTTTATSDTTVDPGQNSTTTSIEVLPTTTPPTITSQPPPPFPPPPSPTTSTPPGTLTCTSGKFRCSDDLGGGCCSSGYTCAPNNCIPPETSIPVTFCERGSYVCPDSVGGGCCPSGHKCGQTTCEASIVVTSRQTTITPTPTIITSPDGVVKTKTQAPFIVVDVSTIYNTVIQTKGAVHTTYSRITPSGTPQTSPEAQEASSSRKLDGGAIGGIVAGGIAAVVILLSAIVFTWRRLSGRGNFELPSAFGGAAFRKKKRRRSRGEGGNEHMGGSAITSSSYNPHGPEGHKRLQDAKFGRSTSESSSGGGYRGTMGGAGGNRGSDGYYPAGTTVSESDGDKSLSSPTNIVNPVTPPGATSPPMLYEADGYAITPPAPPPHPPGPYAGFNDRDAYVMEVGDGEPMPLPVQRWQVTNPDVESVTSMSRLSSRAGNDRERIQVHPGTNF